VLKRGAVMAKLDKKFLAKMGDEWKASTPSLRVQAYHGGRNVLDIGVGKVYRAYDWASVTKIAFTTAALMIKHDEKVFRVNDPVSRWVPWYPESSPWRLRDLLCHSAGMHWWYPFYKDVSKKTDAQTSPEESWEIFQTVLKRHVLKDVRKQNLSERTQVKSLYSDVDFFLLGIALESISGTTLYTAWHDHRDRLGLNDTDFHRGNKPRGIKSAYAPTEDCKWRGRILQGEVHDQNTSSLKGVAPHAGLFGPIDDLSKYGLLLRGAMRGKESKNFASAETVKLFTKRAIPRTRGDWALGFMLPSKENASSGQLFSPLSVGHTGFTGTSLWYDPKRDLLVTILSNRVHPSVENIEIRKLRPKIHTWIAEEL
jgi:CubicO group peptidase (beta-lactamase class C family)